MRVASYFPPFPRQLAVLALASALGFPAWAQQSQQQPNRDSQATAAEMQPSPNSTSATKPAPEGFWGKVNPFARKKWVKKQTDPINDRLGELDEVNARNSRDIKDVDSRSQAGIKRAQSTADQANQTATAAGNQAQNANGIAQGASTHVGQLSTTVNGIDQYRQISDLDITFKRGSTMLSDDARKQLDDLAAGLNGQKGYVLDIVAQSPSTGGAGVQVSQRLADAVKRYLVTEHQIPVYRMHSVALGNAQENPSGGEAQTAEKIHTSNVHVRLMQNSLAAQAGAAPQGATTASAGAERP
jgi:outer membrane protein OmpA-like peptidoglycan-associated protein